jgi:hypothetical protein
MMSFALQYEFLDDNVDYYYYFQSKYIAECIDEIKQELRQENVPIKANAVSKLTYVSIVFSF